MLILLSTIIIINPFFERNVLIQYAHAAAFIIKTNNDVFTPGEELVIFGKGSPNDVLVVRLFDATGKALKIESVSTDTKGHFTKTLLTWPEPSKNFAFGSYTIKINSSIGSKNSQEIPVIFLKDLESSSTTAGLSPALSVKLESPTQVATSTAFRIFVQVTFDGALVNSEPSALLGSSHIHTGNSTINIGSKFVKQHEGIFYADVVLKNEGIYIIHATSFHKGFLAHDSKVISASYSSISSVQQGVNELNNRLNTTHDSLVILQHKLDQTDRSLNDTKTSFTNSISDASTSIKADIASAKSAVADIGQASGQINSIILPILALISVIIALQISLFARIRASYR